MEFLNVTFLGKDQNIHSRGGIVTTKESSSGQFRLNEFCSAILSSIVQVPLIKLLALSQSEINWPYSLRSLIALRPKWILLPAQRYLIGCLCHLCHNVSLILRYIFPPLQITLLNISLIRGINQFVISMRHKGTSREKSLMGQFSFIPSVSAFLDLVMHPVVSIFSCLLYVLLLVFCLY